jgi:spermidine synthase
MICSKKAGGSAPLDPRNPKQPPPGNAPEGHPPLRYYTAELHKAAFVLPQFAQDALASSMTFA